MQKRLWCLVLRRIGSWWNRRRRRNAPAPLWGRAGVGGLADGSVMVRRLHSITACKRSLPSLPHKGVHKGGGEPALAAVQADQAGCNLPSVRSPSSPSLRPPPLRSRPCKA